MTRQAHKAWRAMRADIAASAKQRRDRQHGRSTIPAAVDPATKIEAAKTAAAQQHKRGTRK